LHIRQTQRLQIVGEELKKSAAAAQWKKGAFGCCLKYPG